MAWNTKTQSVTKHTCNSGDGPAFGRKTPGCPRCDELLAGVKPRSWAGMELKKFNDEQRRREIASHDCKKSNCNTVCTAFDY